MAQTGTAIRAKLAAKVFVSPPATNVTITRVSTTSGSLNGYYGQTNTQGTQTTVLGVPYGVTSHNLAFHSFGIDTDGDLMCAVPYDTDVEVKDRVTIVSLSGTFQVMKIKDYPYHGVNVARILTLNQLVA